MDAIRQPAYHGPVRAVIAFIVLISTAAGAYYIPLTMRERIARSNVVGVFRILRVEPKMAYASVEQLFKGTTADNIKIVYNDDGFICSTNSFEANMRYVLLLHGRTRGTYAPVDDAGSEYPATSHALRNLSTLKNGDLVPRVYGSSSEGLVTAH